MGKPSSSSSCFKIIACGGDSVVEDDTQPPEAKGSGEKRGWSFRKRSARHRVLNNSVTSENLTLGGNKEAPQSASTVCQQPAGPALAEKVLALEQPNEKHQKEVPFELQPPKSTEPEFSEVLDTHKPPKPFEPEASDTLPAPKNPESYEPEVPVRIDASESPELVEPNTCGTVSESELHNLVEPKSKTCVPVLESESLTLAELKVPETVEDSTLEPQEPVEPKTCVPVGESESLNLVEPEVTDTVEASALSLQPIEPVDSKCVPVAESESLNIVEPEVIDTVEFSALSLDPTEPVDSKIFEAVIPDSLVLTELKQSETVVSPQDILEEPIIISVQTGVRGFLAQRELVKLRSAVKLQAAIRGYLVRRQAVDTLYCMQGIIKVQILVRTRHSKILGDGRGISVTKPVTEKSSKEKLLRNAFARQLLESTPKSKSTVVKCDPLKPNSTWTWLERWMAVSSSGLSSSEIPEVMAEDEKSQGVELSPIMECEDLSKVISESINPEYAVKEASKAYENEKSSVNSESAEEYQPSSFLSSEEKMEQPYDSTNVSFEETLEMAALRNKTQYSTLSNNLAVETEELKLSTERMVFEQEDVENNKFAYGSRKASNPAFIAAQSKFEVLSSAASNSASLKSPRQDVPTSSLEESVKEKEPIGSKAFIPDETRVNMAGSDCGTELSVTSTLDSPDRSEAEVVDMDLKVKYLEKEASNHISSENSVVKNNGHTNSSLSALVQELPESNGVPKKNEIASDEHDNGEYVVLDMVADSPQVEHKSERSTSELQVQAAYKVSPDATPNHSYVTIVESQGTPSSLVSVKTKRSKVDKTRSRNTKHSSSSGGKKTVAKSLQDSGVISSGNHPSKDQKSGKRRNSFGSTKSDNIDQEQPRDSTSSMKALPSYMQATKSARAKTNSPRSSPDVQDKETLIIKKRHSLPGAGGRQGSPRVERPTSQSPQPQAVKGNAHTPPQERRWVR